AEARTDPNFVIIARSDEVFYGGSIDEAIRRGVAYAEAGADVFFACSTPIAEIDRIAGEIPKPFFDINPPVPAAPQTKLKVDVFTGYLVSASAMLASQMLEDLQKYGEYQALDTRRYPRDQWERALSDPSWMDTLAKWQQSVASAPTPAR